MKHFSPKQNVYRYREFEVQTPVYLTLVQDLFLFLDALASLDFKLSVTESVSDVFTASASTGLSDFFYDFSKGWEDEGYSNQ